jgi:hypothetical protein
MKKFLHGRRHIRARRSVQVGRERRKLHKLNRLVNVELPAFVFRISQIVDRDVPRMIAAAQEMSRAMSNITIGAVRMGEYLQRRVIIPTNNSQIGASNGFPEIEQSA